MEQGYRSPLPPSWQELIAVSQQASTPAQPFQNRSYTLPVLAIDQSQPQGSSEKHLLQSVLSPQVLKQHHLSEEAVQRLYRALHIYSLGFHQVVADITLHATNRHQLLTLIWKAFLQLWEEALQVSFESRVTGLAEERDDLVAALVSAQDAAADTSQQNRELQERLRSLVAGAITRMAREKAYKAQIADLEGQLKVLKDTEAANAVKAATQAAADAAAKAAAETAAKAAVRSHNGASLPQSLLASKQKPARNMSASNTWQKPGSESTGQSLQKELQEAQAAIEEKQVFLRQAYKLATQAEARSKQLQQELDQTLERCLLAEAARDEEHARCEAMAAELQATSTARYQQQSDRLTNRNSLKAQRHEVSRVDSRSDSVKAVQHDCTACIALQQQLVIMSERTEAAEASQQQAQREAALQQHHKEQLLDYCQPILAWMSNLVMDDKQKTAPGAVCSPLQSSADSIMLHEPSQTALSTRLQTPFLSATNIDHSSPLEPSSSSQAAHRQSLPSVQNTCDGFVRLANMQAAHDSSSDSGLVAPSSAAAAAVVGSASHDYKKVPSLSSGVDKDGCAAVQDAAAGDGALHGHNKVSSLSGSRHKDGCAAVQDAAAGLAKYQTSSISNSPAETTLTDSFALSHSAFDHISNSTPSNDQGANETCSNQPFNHGPSYADNIRPLLQQLSDAVTGAFSVV